MKNLTHLLYLILLMHLTTNLMTQIPFPDYTTRPSWRIKDIYNSDASSNEGVYRLGTETIMGGRIFLKVFCKKKTETKDSLVGFMTHGDMGTSKIYIKSVASDLYPNPKLHLLYDFSLGVGDTTYCAPSNLYADSDSFKFWVERIDVKVYEGIPRKQLKMGYSTIGGDDLGIMYWVEGIGSLFHPFYLFDCYTGGCESNIFLTCFENDNRLEYKNSHYSDCLTTATDDWTVNDADIKLFPSSVSDELFVENKTGKPLTVSIFNNLGQLLQTQPLPNERPIIDIHTLPQGIYHAVFKDNRFLKTLKFVKSD